jgi:O-antigen ligase
MDEAGGARFQRSSHILDHWFKTVGTMLFGLGSSASGDLIGIYTHMVPVDILSEEGIVGFLIYVGIILTCVKDGLRSFSLVRYNPAQRARFAILAGLFAYYFLLSLKQGTMLGSSLLFMVAILIGKHRKTVSHHPPRYVMRGNRSNAAPINLG